MFVGERGNLVSSKLGKMNRFNVIITLIFILIEIPGIMEAQDRHFAWTYESVTLPKGNIDLEPWVTYFTGRENYYSRYEARLEFETGLTDRLQTALYLNSKHETSTLTDSTGGITGLMKKSGYSFSNEWKLNILNPSTAPVGLGLYAEYGISPDEIELEFKLLLDKKGPQSIIAYNLVNEFEFEYEFEEDQTGKGEIELEREYIIENDLACIYLFKPAFGIGLEARNRNEIVKGEIENAAFFLGPTLFYSQKNFFAIINILPLLAEIKGENGNLSEYEKFAARIILGISF